MLQSSHAYNNTRHTASISSLWLTITILFSSQYQSLIHQFMHQSLVDRLKQQLFISS